MALNDKEKAAISIANAIAVYSVRMENNDGIKNESMIDFVLKTVPEELKPEISIELIDEVFEFISKSHVERS